MGDTQVQSHDGLGSIFTMLLPRQRKGAALPAMLTSSPDYALSASPGAKTVLVIDDDPNARDLIVRALAKAQLRIEVAASAEEGLRLARALAPTSSRWMCCCPTWMAGAFWLP